MEVQVNGEWRAFDDGATVAEVLRAIDAPERGVAVALDGQVVRRGEWAAKPVPPGARLEILTAVQGG
ncbi:sulfur carrier protein ThiS [Amycolatopsis thermophila]|uniref:Sulfur carrier protein n=1 Tax=Amycolatopsis thermophila TaxID=206084 RepID=A0ABU0EU73_9PSEU|nr:sulfur carrier protein ThiS [Amycolatopsis thermophila]MDQ0378856.1 sulfur carrier protein [Amycolatopsis thermophila]